MHWWPDAAWGGSGCACSPGSVTSIPLSEESPVGDGQTVGSLVREATTHLSTLVRAEVELAKNEIASEAKKAAKGSAFFVLALTVLATILSSGRSSR